MEFFSRTVVCLILLFIFCGELSAQLKGELRQGEISDYSIAVSPLLMNRKADTELGKKLTETMERDLDMTGYFKVLNRKGFLESAETEKPDMKNWLNIGANGLVKGFLSGSDSSVEMELVFYDVAGTKEMLRKKYKSSTSSISQGIHNFVRDLVFLLAGEKIKFFSSKIALIEKTGGKYSLILVNFDGSDKEVLYSSNKILLLPAWNKNGREIFFTSYSKGEPFLYSIDLSSRNVRLVSDFPGLNTSASSTPDGNSIALTLSKDGNTEIYLMNLRSRYLSRLTNNNAIDTAPSFSPDGKEVAFVSNRSGNPHIYRLFVNNPSRVERLTVQGKYNQDPDYSPDGKYIAFTGRDELYRFDIFIFDIASRAIARISQNQGKNESPSFSPDGKLLVFSSDRQGKNKLFISNIKGDKQFLIYESSGEAVTPAWSPEIITTK